MSAIALRRHVRVLKKESRTMRTTHCVLATIAMLAVTAAPASAQDADDASAEELAKKSQNPVANMISVPFEQNSFFDVGPTDKYANVVNLKPVIPVSVGPVNLINRLILPIIYLEGQSRTTKENTVLGRSLTIPSTDSEFGLGNLTYQAFFSPADPGPIIWGLGPAVVLPTNTDDSLGSDTLSLGPSAVVLSMPGKWVVGGLLQQV